MRRQIQTYTSQLSDSIQPIHDLINRRFLVFPDKYALEHDCGKLRKLSGLLKTLQNQGHRCLIFTQMSRMLDILEKFLNLHGYTYVRLDGSTKVQDRQKFVDRFNLDERIFAFISSTRSGGLGLNLTGADTVIFYDTDWNPAMDKQAQDRCHRIGQTRSVHIYRLISSYTIEENILKKALQKLHLDQLIMEGGEFNTQRLQSSRIKVRDLFEEIKDEEIEQACKMVEDAEDYKAFRKAQQEEQTDKIDFDEDGKIEMNEYEFLDQVDTVTRQAIDTYISLNPLDEQDVPIAESGQLSDNEPDNDESDFDMKAQMCENGENIYRERLELLKSRYIVY